MNGVAQQVSGFDIHTHPHSHLQYLPILSPSSIGPLTNWGAFGPYAPYSTLTARLFLLCLLPDQMVNLLNFTFPVPIL